jgi:hypothetical protein
VEFLLVALFNFRYSIIFHSESFELLSLYR